MACKGRTLPLTYGEAIYHVCQAAVLCTGKLRTIMQNVDTKTDSSMPIIEHINLKKCTKYNRIKRGLGSSVGIATELRTGRSGIESQWRRDFPPVQTGPGAHPASCKMRTGSFPGVNCGRGVLLTTLPLLVPRSWKSRAIPLPTLWATPGL